MKRAVALIFVVVLAACSGDDAGSEEGGSSETVGFLDQFEGEATSYDGHDVKIDEAERVVYVEDCAVAREMTATDGPYGPEDGQSGYAYICDE